METITCKNCGAAVVEFYPRTRRCRNCVLKELKIRSKIWYQKNKSSRSEQIRQWQLENKERRYETNRKLYQRKKGQISKQHKEWRANNKERFGALRANNKLIRVYRLKVQKISRKYAKELIAIYQNRPHGHHVDHIVPIKNPVVCGLHVPWNLQYLPVIENMRKHNSFWPDMPT